MPWFIYGSSWGKGSKAARESNMPGHRVKDDYLATACGYYPALFSHECPENPDSDMCFKIWVSLMPRLAMAEE